jgi:hypothetical protein
MSSPFVDLSAAIANKLLEAPQIVSDRVSRSRQAALKKGWDNGIVVRLARTRADLAGVGLGAPKDWETLIGVECFARAAPGVLAEDAVDAIVVAAYARLAGLSPAGLSVLDIAAEPSIVWDTDEGEDPVCRATFVVSITHRTQAAALVAWPG